jgi:beta-phosphoglucomutase
MDAFRRPQGCIFNLDGVIVDTARYHYAAWRRLANEMEFDFSPVQHEELRGLSRMASLERILEWGGCFYMTEAEKLYWSDIKNNWYVELIANLTPADVLPGARVFLAQVKAEGLKVALSSASRSARAVLRSIELESFFDVVVDGNSTRKNKPDPECFLLAAHALHLPASECLVFEDAPAGVDAALLGGFTVVGVGRPEYLPKAHFTTPNFEKTTFSGLLARMRVLALENA